VYRFAEIKLIFNFFYIFKKYIFNSFCYREFLINETYSRGDVFELLIAKSNRFFQMTQKSSYANQNGALKSCASEQRSDAKKGKSASLSANREYIFGNAGLDHAYFCMIAETLYTISSSFFSSSSIILRLRLSETIFLKACLT